MPTSQTILQENAIVLATTNKFIELGQIASERIINGKTPEKQDEKAEQILQLLTAYRRKDRLSDDNLESLLNAMKLLSGANSFPSVDPIVGQDVIYRITGVTTNDGDGGGTGVDHYRGRYDLSSNVFPSTGGNGPSGAPAAGDFWVGGDLAGGTLKDFDESLRVVAARTMLIALITSPGQFGVNWRINE